MTRATSKLRRDVLGDRGKAQNIDMQRLTGTPRRVEILAAVIPQTEVQTLRAVDCLTTSA